jgi:hypothetical protein
MLRPIDNWYLQKDEPARSCLGFLRSHIVKMDPRITEAWKYGMPFFCYDGKMFCYLWVHKKFRQPYLGIVEGQKINHPDLLQEKRARMKIFLLNPEKDLPIKTIDSILQQTIRLYKSRK